MKPPRLHLALAAGLLLITGCDRPASAPAVSDNPSEEFRGFTETRGGEGGEILRVTSLDGAGPGTLRAAMEAEGPRIVVFEVGGVIDLEGEDIKVRNPFLTVAGQTAPEPGVTVIRGMIHLINTHDIVIRHLRIRPGDNDAKPGTWEKDALTTNNARDVIIDHCSLTWATDENLSASGPRHLGLDHASRRVTFSNNLIAEALDDSTHSKGGHSAGSAVNDFTREFAIIGNLYAHNRQRNPLVKADATGIIANNLIYNPGDKSIHLARVDSQFDQPPPNCRVTIVGNVLQHGPDTDPDLPLVIVPSHYHGDAWIGENLAFLADGSPAPIWSGNLTLLPEPPAWPEGFTPLPPNGTAEHVLSHAGARPAARDAIDRRIVETVRSGGGRIIDSQAEVGGYPAPEPTRRSLDVPAENRPAWLEQLHRELLP